MDNQKLRAIANSHQLYDGAVTVWMLPITTLRLSLAINKAYEFFGISAEKWATTASDAQTMFYLAEGHMGDLEVQNVADDNPLTHEINGLGNYWDNRNGDFGNNWEWFISCVTDAGVYQLYEAYKETRRVMPKIESEILQGDVPDIATDPLETGSGRKRSKKKSATT